MIEGSVSQLFSLGTTPDYIINFLMAHQVTFVCITLFILYAFYLYFLWYAL
jgi:hypothetical protein